MDIKEYISSGIIEHYVLGLVSEEERRDVVRMKEAHPEVAETIAAYEKSMEDYSALHAVSPPDDLKAEMMHAIREEKSRNIISLPQSLSADHKTIRKMKIWRRIAVAAIILLIISAGINSFYLPKYREYKKRYTLLVANQQRILAENQAMETRLETVEGSLHILMNPDLKPVTMKGVNNHKGLTATVFWNNQNRRIYLGKMNLPAPPSGKTYQLWAIIDGKPVNLGVYNPEKDKVPKAMKKVTQGNIQAFAITLEKAGGSSTPTMDQMYVMGSTS